MKHLTNKTTLAAVLGRPLIPGELLFLDPAQMSQTDLGSAVLPGAIVLLNFPLKGCVTRFEKSGSHWKIGVSCMILKSCPEEEYIWNAALRSVSKKLGKHSGKTKERLWIQRLWLPLHRDGDVAMEFIRLEVTPVIAEARKLLTELGASGLTLIKA